MGRSGANRTAPSLNKTHLTMIICFQASIQSPDEGLTRWTPGLGLAYAALVHNVTFCQACARAQLISGDIIV